MFPIRDDNPRVLIPFVTYGIVALNVAAWIFLQGMGTEPVLSSSVCQYGLIPADVLQLAPAGTRLQMGETTWCQLGDASGWPTLFSSMFMHGSWLHLIGNMWFMWIFADNVESSMGHLRFAIFYLLCGLGAAGLQMAAHPASTIPMVGASGAIGGVMGAYIMLYPRVNVHLLLILGFFITTVAVPAVFMLGYWFLLQLLSGISTSAEGGGVAFWAHVGGFIAGAVLIFVFRNKQLLARHPYYGWRGRRPPTRRWHRIGR